jgi:hypothetical protein
MSGGQQTSCLDNSPVAIATPEGSPEDSKEMETGVSFGVGRQPRQSARRMSAAVLRM